MRSAIAALFLLFFSAPVLAEDITQTTYGDCSAAIANNSGTITIHCNDKKAMAAITSLQKQVDKLVSLSEQKHKILVSQIQAIQRLVELKKNSNNAPQYDEAMDSLRDGDVLKASGIIKNLIDESKYQKNDVGKAAMHRELGALWFVSNTRESIKAYKKSLQLDNTNIEAWTSLGALYERTEQHYKAIESYTNALELAKTITNGDAQGQIMLKLAYLHRADKGTSAQYIFEAVNYYRETFPKDSYIQSRGLLSLQYMKAKILYEQHEYKDAKKEIGMLLALHQLSGVKDNLSNAYIYQGLILRNLQEPDEALKSLQAALDIDTKNGNKDGIALSNFNIGNIYYDKRDYVTAETYYVKSLEYYRSTQNEVGMANCYASLGNVSHAEKNNVNAHEYFKMSYDIYLRIGKMSQAVTMRNRMEMTRGQN
ncbi:MAG: tetratricopeptide repeat protein [Gammaproteobacteria bacterium]|nr:tetratricopeptide repeat protein [Gammaproteobacteria bacterium]MDH5650558.1 tetratricopeptide repeat protein [Gammaproteobacteria bacterium]